MSHARAQIRNALVARLIGLAVTTTHVYASRFYMFDDATLPGLRIYADSEEKLGEHMGGRQMRRVQFTVEAVAKQHAGLDDTLDQIALEVETAIATEQTLGGLVKGGVRYEGIEDFRTDDSLEHPVGVWPLRFSADYDVDANAPDVIT